MLRLGCCLPPIKLFGYAPGSYHEEISEKSTITGSGDSESRAHNRLPLSCVLSNMPTFALTQKRRCVKKPFVQRNIDL